MSAQELPATSRLPATLRALFSIDLRSLAAFRIAVGSMLLADLALRAFDLTAHYTDLGALPRIALQATENGRFLSLLSLHFLGGSFAFQASLFALAAAAALAMVLGYRTRLVTALSWLLLVSLQNRNPVISYGGDIFLVLMMFWSLFLPLGARFSLDAARGRGAPPESGHVLSGGSCGLLVQIACIYCFSALHKSGTEWVPDGSAIYYALHIDEFALPPAVWLRQIDWPLRLLTYAVYALEISFPLLLFAPRFFVPLRMFAAVSIFGFHIGLVASLYLLLFNWIGALTAVVLLPGWFWDEALPRLRGQRPFSGAWASALAPPQAAGSGLGASPAANVLAALAMAFVIASNVATLREDWASEVENSGSLRWVVSAGLAFRLGQTWAMFSPHPPKQTEWTIVEGRLDDGRRVDLLRWTQNPPSFEKPTSRADYHPSGRWERFLRYANDNDYVNAFESLRDYYCRRWNNGDENRGRLVGLRILGRREYNLPDRTRTLSEPKLLFRAGCHPKRPRV